MTAWQHLFTALSREVAPDQAGTAWPFGQTLLPGDCIELSNHSSMALKVGRFFCFGVASD
jgi:hypothetical protein